MRAKVDKIIIKIILVIVTLIILLSLALIVKNFNSTYFKTFEFKDKSAPNKSRLEKNTDDSSNKCLQATVTSDNIINLGDFLFILADNRKLAANISFKYKKINMDSHEIFDNQDSTEEEIKSKNSILRDRIIGVMFAKTMPTIDDKEMKQAMIKTLNKNLTTIKAEEIYFNKFIMY